MYLHYLLDFRLTLLAAIVSVVIAVVQKFRRNLATSTDTWWCTETAMYCWALETSLLTIRFCESWSIHVAGDPKSTHWNLLVTAISQSFVAMVFVLIVAVINGFLRSKTFGTAWCKATISFGVFSAFAAVLLDWIAVFFFGYIARFYLN